MSEGKEGIMTASEEIVAKLWEVLDAQRRFQMPAEHIEVVLLLVSLYKDGYLGKELLAKKSPLKVRLINTFLKSDDQLSQTYAAVYAGLESDFKALDENVIAAILSTLFGVNKLKLQDNFYYIFEQLLYRIDLMKVRREENALQPYELSAFLRSFIYFGVSGKVFNPFAGMASFGGFHYSSISFSEVTFYYGQEINPKVWAVGTLRLMILNNHENSKYVCTDSTLNWPEQAEKFDLIITHLPFNLNFQKQFGQWPDVYKTLEAFVINKSLGSLTEKGKLVVILPKLFLSALGENYDVRKHLVSNDLLETVMTFPDGMMQQSKAQFALVILNKQKEKSGIVRFVIADQFVKGRKSGELIFKHDELLSALYEYDITKEDNEFVKDVNQGQIKSFDYNLNALLYFTKEIKGVKLRELLKPIKGKRLKDTFVGRIVRIRNLKDDQFNYKLKDEDIVLSEVNLRNIQLINEPCLLLANQFKSLKPTFFEFSGEAIGVNTGIIPYKVNEEKVDIGYLINELHKEYVQEQLDAYRTGSVIPFIRREDLLEVMVELPPLEMQRAKMTGVQEGNVAAKVKEAILEAEKHGLYNQFFQEIAALKHAMSKPLFKINTQVKRLRQLVKAEEAGEKETSSQLIQALLTSIEGNLLNASNILEYADFELRTEDFELEAVDIIKFLNQFFIELEITYKDRFRFFYSIADVTLKDIGKVYINANTDLLKILLDNIIDNVLRHSFTNQGVEYEIEFYFDLHKLKNAPFFQLEIFYNGKPFPANFDQEKFVRKHVKAGKTAHTGQGGYQIDQIVKRFGGYFTLDTNYLQKAPTCFNFYFPVVEINIEDHEVI